MPDPPAIQRVEHQADGRVHDTRGHEREGRISGQAGPEGFGELPGPAKTAGFEAEFFGFVHRRARRAEQDRLEFIGQSLRGIEGDAFGAVEFAAVQDVEQRMAGWTRHRARE